MDARSRRGRKTQHARYPYQAQFACIVEFCIFFAIRSFKMNTYPHGWYSSGIFDKFSGKFSEDTGNAENAPMQLFKCLMNRRTLMPIFGERALDNQLINVLTRCMCCIRSLPHSIIMQCGILMNANTRRTHKCHCDFEMIIIWYVRSLLKHFILINYQENVIWWRCSSRLLDWILLFKYFNLVEIPLFAEEKNIH